MHVHVIDLHRFEVYEAGATLISLLAYPGDSEEETRAGVHASLCHHALRVKCEIEPDWALSAQRTNLRVAHRARAQARSP